MQENDTLELDLIPLLNSSKDSKLIQQEPENSKVSNNDDSVQTKIQVLPRQTTICLIQNKPEFELLV